MQNGDRAPMLQVTEPPEKEDEGERSDGSFALPGRS